MRRGPLAAPSVVLGSTALAIVLAIGAGGTDVDVLGILWFLLVCPGLAVVPLLDLDDVWTELTLTLAISITLGTLLATALLFAGLWSATAIFVLLALLSVGGAGVQVLRAVRE